jgi:hypothetical protein
MAWGYENEISYHFAPTTKSKNKLEMKVVEEYRYNIRGYMINSVRTIGKAKVFVDIIE